MCQQNLSTSQKNQDRALTQIIKQIAREKKIKAQFISHDWIIRLTKNKQTKHIWGYNFELNSATAQILASDKSAASDLLEINKVPVVEHKIFINPKLEKFVSHKGNWQEILKYFKKNNNKIIAKANNNTSGGTNVFLIQNQVELETAINHLFSKYRSMSLSPFYNIKNEYRIIVLDNAVQIIYKKEIPKIIGDGKLNILELIIKKFSLDANLADLIQKIQESNITLTQILPINQELKLNWKHNLRTGATPEIIKNKKLEKLAIKATKAINIKFASIDIVEVENQFLVLEINSGIMMESFAKYSQKNYDIAKDIYKKAILKML